VISNGLVAVAKGTRRVIVLEDLRGIRTRATVRPGQRERHGKWAFDQLRAFIEYKAKLSARALKMRLNSRFLSLLPKILKPSTRRFV
jgi:IS605 OrfB family transposase